MELNQAKALSRYSTKTGEYTEGILRVYYNAESLLTINTKSLLTKNTESLLTEITG